MDTSNEFMSANKELSGFFACAQATKVSTGKWSLTAPRLHMLAPVETQGAKLSIDKGRSIACSMPTKGGSWSVMSMAFVNPLSHFV